MIGKRERQARLLPAAQMPRPTREATIQRAILEALPKLGVMAWRNHVGATKIGGRWQRFGVPGSADIFAVVRGRFVAIEVKRPGGKLSDRQRLWHIAVTNAGGIVITSDDADATLRAVRDLLREFSP